MARTTASIRSRLRASRFPESLFCITWDDGERYARTDEHVADAAGRQRVIFRHDPDGLLTGLARARFSDIPAS